MKTITFILLCLVFASCSCQYQTIPRGKKYSEDSTSEYKLYFQDSQGNIVSPWHDVPLFTQADRSNQTYNMIVEIPRFSQAKFEIHRGHLMNPIVHDKKNNHTRYLPNVFPWHGHVCNYGAFPQTWESPFHEDEWTGLAGDQDPIDVCEIGSKSVATGTVLPVKILGILALIDGEENETDWKVIVMNSEEADEKSINTLDDLNEEYPDLLESVRKFFRVYWTPTGKPENKFAYNGEVQDKALALEVISYTNQAWKEMISNCSISGEKFNTGNTLQGTPCTVDIATARREVDSQSAFDPVEAELPDTVDDWSFLKSSASTMGGRIFQPFFLIVFVLILVRSFL